MKTEDKVTKVMKYTMYIIFAVIVIVGVASFFVESDDISYQNNSTPTSSSSNW